MNIPSVCCVMLADGRPEMVARAGRSFHAQTYKAKHLMILDSGLRPVILDEHFPKFPALAEHELPSSAHYEHLPGLHGQSIGHLRNAANSYNSLDLNSDIIVHFDSDDWSYPTRIAEQVELLQSSGADAVSYNEMLFWRSSCQVHIAEIPGPLGFHPVFRLHDDEAWLYRNTNPACPIGTSLCYWRKTWERNPFANRNVGEDLEWWGRLEKRAMESSLLLRCSNEQSDIAVRCHNSLIAPHMIASVHGGNTVRQAISPDSENWQRVPEWDEYCREAMKL